MKKSEIVVFEATAEDVDIPSFNLEIGHTYSAILNDTRYDNLVCSQLGPYAFIGSNPINPNPELPFSIFTIDGSIDFETDLDEEVYSITIIEHTQVIDEKYLSNIKTDINVEDLPIMTEGEVVLFDQQVDEFEYESGSNAYYYKELESNIRLYVGELYKVIFDGTEYSDLVCYEENDCLWIGACEDYLEYPFGICNYDSDGKNYLSLETNLNAESHTFTITRKGLVVGEKYLPNISISEDKISNIVKYTEQELTDEEKTQARVNIGAASISDVESTMNELLSSIIFAEGQTF